MMDYGLRWSEWGKDNRPKMKEKFFPTAEKRDAFATKVSEKDSFHEFVAWSDPQVTHH